MDDSNWTEEADFLETGSMLIFGQIDVFVGMIRSSRAGKEQYEPEFESESGSTTMTEMDGEESVGSPEFEATTEDGESANQVMQDSIVTPTSMSDLDTYT